MPTHRHERTVLYAVPRLDVWVVCPRCEGPALVHESGASCTVCLWRADGARAGSFCGCCWRWEGDVARPARPMDAEIAWRCPDCGQRETTVTRVSPNAPAPRHLCGCGAGMVLMAQRSTMHVRDGVDALYGLPFWLRTPCAGHELWVANRLHADYLAEFIASPIRPHGSEHGHELGHRLPAWLISARNRGAVLKSIGKLLAQVDQLTS